LFNTISIEFEYSNFFQSLHPLEETDDEDATCNLVNGITVLLLPPLVLLATVAVAFSTALYSANHNTASLKDGCAVGLGVGRLVRWTPVATGAEVVGTLVGRLLGS
jgi:hypothetical protein